MKLLSAYLLVPVTLSALSLLTGCSSDQPSPSNTAGASAGGAAQAGSSAAGSSAAGASVAGATAGGGAGGASSAGGGSGGANTAGGGPSSAGGAAVEASFATVKTVIMASCFGGGCHNEEGNPLQMEIDDKLYGTLTSKSTKNCGKLLNTANPAESALVKVLLGDCGTPPNTTPRMPFQKCWPGDLPADNEACVSTANVEAIKAWIAKGAPQ